MFVLLFHLKSSFNFIQNFFSENVFIQDIEPIVMIRAQITFAYYFYLIHLKFSRVRYKSTSKI